MVLTQENHMIVLTNYIQPDGGYDLIAALQNQCPQCIGSHSYKQAVDFIERTEELVPLKKLSIAAHTLVAAINIATSKTRH